MKTTNYEISKQLAEAGFKTNEENQIWNYKGQEIWSVPAFDLETILEALPKFIKYNNREYCLTFWVAGKEMYYEIIGENDLLENYFYIFATEKKENESLADMAAKLWLKLKKEGLV